MNREEAHNEHRVIDKNNKWFNYDLQLSGLLEKIFDDFESRTCENCKYMTKDSTGYPRCSNKSSIMPYEDGAISLNVDLEFGCNQFKRKDDE